ncbi:DUF1152 domain-containing protein [Streptomyces sp. XY332]|uniref:DUF1152 domain-containing protein n=1 Tax=Streptomyces sp. XY332 TaxID=1415561 RepID=UPI000D14AEE1|nr:DUF1152 domain-containing protein [Streptomyces sp. XY332]
MTSCRADRLDLVDVGGAIVARGGEPTLRSPLGDALAVRLRGCLPAHDRYVPGPAPARGVRLHMPRAHWDGAPHPVQETGGSAFAESERRRAGAGLARRSSPSA